MTPANVKDPPAIKTKAISEKMNCGLIFTV